MSQIKQLVHLSKISNVSPSPVQMFQNIIDKSTNEVILMNLATVDKEFGVLNRSVVYRGLNEGNICFVTEKNSRKYQNLKESPKLSLTILCPSVEQVWQIRLFNAEARELNEDQIKDFWQKEQLFAKIRSHICECGKPVDDSEREKKYEEVVGKYEKESKEPEQTETYTAFEIVPKLWDFYMSEPQKIADRIQYKLIEGEKDQWETYHLLHEQQLPTRSGPHSERPL